MKKISFKIKKWLSREDLNLKDKWWHRLFKVFFILSILFLFILVITFLNNSYSRIVHNWEFVNTVTGRLNSNDYSGKIISIKKLYSDNEIINDGDMYTKDYSFSLNDKDYLLPYYPPIFLENVESFCSDKLSAQAKEIAYTNNIKLFSTTDSSFERLFTDINRFTSYLNLNSIKCVMIDSYSITNDNGTMSKYTFLKPVDTYKYSIYKYQNNFLGFILNIILSIIGLILYTFVVLIIYNKIILYIIYGNKK